jgi:prohibitin 2
MNKIKAAAAAGSMVKLALAGGTLWFDASKTLYNVEGGHRAIVFNRFEGIKDKVRLVLLGPTRPLPPRSLSCLPDSLDLAVVSSPFPCLQVYPEGTHLIIPLIERPIIYDVRARPNLVESTSGSRDLQMVTPDPLRSSLLIRSLMLNLLAVYNAGLYRI